MKETNQSLRIEVRRKLFHLLSIFYAIGYIYVDRALVIKVFLGMVIVVLMLELGRLYLPKFNQIVVKNFGGIHRPKELNHISGIFWTLLGVLILVATVPDRKIVLCCMGYLIFGDCVAALVGMKWGVKSLFGKSLLGSLSFFGICFLIGLAFFSPGIALLGAACAALSEFLPLPFSDNLWIPIIPAHFLLVVT